MTLLCYDGGRCRRNFCFFLLDSFKTFLEDSLILSLRERKKKKESEKDKKKGEGGLKPALLVGRNITTQAPSNNTNNTNNNISSNLRPF
jgi:hypothetical protein